jgi:hypothetical protein
MIKQVEIRGTVWNSLDCSIVPNEVLCCPAISAEAKVVYMLISGMGKFDEEEIMGFVRPDEVQEAKDCIDELLRVGLLIQKAVNSFELRTTLDKAIPFDDASGCPCVWHEGEMLRLPTIPRGGLKGVMSVICTAPDGTCIFVEVDYGQ